MKKILIAIALLATAASTASAANMRVVIRNSNDRYYSATNGGGSSIYANRVSSQGEWEKFLLVDLNGGALMSSDWICIETWHRYYIVAEGGGGSVVKADRTNCGPWEKFRIWKLDDYGRRTTGAITVPGRIALQASGGHYVSVERDGRGSVVANRTAIGPWERNVIFGW